MLKPLEAAPASTEITLHQVTPELMAEIMRDHIVWLETYSQTRPDLHPLGLDLLPAFNYELIQLMNHVWLQAQAQLENPVEKEAST